MILVGCGVDKKIVLKNEEKKNSQLHERKIKRGKHKQDMVSKTLHKFFPKQMKNRSKLKQDHIRKKNKYVKETKWKNQMRLIEKNQELEKHVNVERK